MTCIGNITINTRKNKSGNATIYIRVLKCIKDTHRFDLGHPPIRSISTPSLIWIHFYFFLCLLLYCLYMSYILCYNYFIKRGLRKSKVVITCDQSNSAFDLKLDVWWISSSPFAVLAVISWFSCNSISWILNNDIIQLSSTRHSFQI
jgi:hypothetical protein